MRHQASNIGRLSYSQQGQDFLHNAVIISFVIAANYFKSDKTSRVSVSYPLPFSHLSSLSWQIMRVAAILAMAVPSLVVCFVPGSQKLRTNGLQSWKLYRWYNLGVLHLFSRNTLGM